MNLPAVVSMLVNWDWKKRTICFATSDQYGENILSLLFKRIGRSGKSQMLRHCSVMYTCEQDIAKAGCKAPHVSENAAKSCSLFVFNYGKAADDE